MIDTRESLVGNIAGNQELNGEVNKGIEKTILQEKTITPTEQTQNVLPDENYDGLSKVIVNPIPSEYIVPSGTLAINNNGEYNVKEYETANVSIPNPPLQSKNITITQNGDTIIQHDEGYYGLDQVNITTDVSGSGADLSEYFYTEITQDTTSNYMSDKIVKKVPDVTVANNVSSLSHCYYQCSLKVLPKVVCGTNIYATDYMYYYTNSPTIDASGLNTTNVTNMRGMFQRSSNQTALTNIIFSANFITSKVTDFRNMFSFNSSITSLDLSTFSCEDVNSCNCGSMFQNCSSLMHLDMRNFSFNKISSSGNMFNNVPDACEIIVKDDTQKTWFSTNFSRFTNVKKVSEL